MMDTTPEGKLLNLIRNAQSKARIGKDLKIFTKVNVILMAIIGIVAVVFLADVFIFKEKPAEGPGLDIQAKLPQPKPIAIDTEEEIPQPLPGTDEGIITKKIPKEEILGNLNLLGIITGDNNQAIVEDKALKKTFFLYKGDSLGELKVYEIKDNAVILEYMGDKIELRM
ncbi:MAG: hypothetical protein Q8O12_00125 [Candidatus Omnitrophota bacterium]|nr:hypothetical protein [Candidatus Omnitrophota bacterium]